MTNLTPHDLTFILLAMAILLGTARLLGEIARRFQQPPVLGEIAAGILLGPTILGRLSPELQTALFPTEGSIAIVLEAVFALSVVLFLLVAGLEVDLSVAFKQGKTAFSVASLGMLFPFVIGFAVAWFTPSLLMEVPEGREVVFALFIATALCISALPVIVKILKDLALIKTDLGVIVVAAAIVNDLLGWIIFAVVLGLIGAGKGGLPIEMVILLTLLFVALILTVGRWIIHRLLPIIQAHMSWPAGVLTFSLSVALLCAALTEWIGIHAIFGAFIFGVALGDSHHLRQRTRATLDHFISFTFAPLFFASIGLRVDFIGNFVLLPVIIIFALACVGKIAGCYIGGRIGGLSSRESLAVGFAKNARGAMEIILGLLALQYGLIDQKLFVALVVMALLTSMVGGSLVQTVLNIRKKVTIKDYLSTTYIEWKLSADTRQQVIEKLAEIACRKDIGYKPAQVAKAAWEREQIMPTGLEHRVAVPHARLPGLKKPIVVVGRLLHGVDFDAIDGQAARLVFFALTPTENSDAQLQILRAIGETARDLKAVNRLLEAQTATEFLALLNLDAEDEAH